MRTVNIVFELISFSFWNTILIQPFTLSLTNMHKNTEQRENNEVSRWMSHSRHRITYGNVKKASNVLIIKTADLN